MRRYVPPYIEHSHRPRMQHAPTDQPACTFVLTLRSFSCRPHRPPGASTGGRPPRCQPRHVNPSSSLPHLGGPDLGACPVWHPTPCNRTWHRPPPPWPAAAAPRPAASSCRAARPATATAPQCRDSSPGRHRPPGECRHGSPRRPRSSPQLGPSSSPWAGRRTSSPDSSAPSPRPCRSRGRCRRWPACSTPLPG